MKDDLSSNPAAPLEISAINQRVAVSVRSHQRRIRALTGFAFLLGFLAVAASVIIVSAYFVFYRPKEKEVLRHVTLAAEQAKANPAPAEGGTAPKLPFDFPSVQATMTFFHSVVIALLAGAMGLLALGTLVLVAVVVINRRATLQQVNVSLAQISTQLKELQLQNPKH